MKAIVATFIILFATGAAAQGGILGLASSADVSVSVFATDQPQCRVHVDGLQDEAELVLRRSGIQVSSDRLGFVGFGSGSLGVSIVALDALNGCVAAAQARLITYVFLQTPTGSLDQPIVAWGNPDTVFASSSETAMNRQIRDFLRDEVVSVSNAILKARAELPQCANAADTLNGRRLWEECVEEAYRRWR